MSEMLEQIGQLSPRRRMLLEALLRREKSQWRPMTITPRLRESNRAPLSFAQQRLWFIDQLGPGNAAYNIQVAVRLRGALNVAALGAALQEVVNRHEALRTTFAFADGEPLQVIHPHLELSWVAEDLSHLPAVEREGEMRRLGVEEARQPFDLAQGPLLRARLLRLDRHEHVALLTMHHIVADGWSAGVLVREMTALYEAFAAGKPSPLAPLPIQYADYAEWQRDWLQGEALEEQLAYWQRRLSGVSTLMLPTDRPRPPTPSYRGANEAILFSEGLSASLRALARSEGVTLFMALLAALQTLLYLWTGRTDIVVGTDIANRTREETERLIGFFVNLLALRTDFSGAPTFYELLRQVQRVTLDAYAHQEAPFEKLVAALKLERDLSRFPVFQVVLVLQNIPFTETRLPGLELSPVSFGSHFVKFDLILFITDEGGRLRCNLDYSTDLFDRQTMVFFLRRFENVLSQVVQRPGSRVEELELMTEREKKQMQSEEHRKREDARRKLQFARRKGVDLARVEPVKIFFLTPDATLPLVIEPNLRDCNLGQWAANHYAWVEEKLLRHGAILLRGFDVATVGAFEQVAGSACAELFGEYGDLPRALAGEKVYGSTPYPSDQAILYHNESSHLHCWPMKIFFYCVEAAQQDGATPIVDCREVYRLLDPALRERFGRLGLMYVRNYTEALDVSWQDFFKTEDKAQVEIYCREAGVECEWKPDGGLRTRRVCKAIRRHPRTGETVFFNQLQLHHISCLEPNTSRSLRSLFREEDYPRQVCYGDGSPIEDSAVDEVRRVCERAAVRFAWQAGDILMLDNMLTAHGRDPFTGPRQIVVAMGEMMNDSEAQTGFGREAK
jgi:alpha-ketoglutarate-dependent taurine dioxygenase